MKTCACGAPLATTKKRGPQRQRCELCERAYNAIYRSLERDQLQRARLTFQALANAVESGNAQQWAALVDWNKMARPPKVTPAHVQEYRAAIRGKAK